MSPLPILSGSDHLASKAEWRGYSRRDYPMYNNQRHFGPIGYTPPAEAEANYYAAKETLDMVA